MPQNTEMPVLSIKKTRPCGLGGGGAFKPRTCVFGGVVEIRLLSLTSHTRSWTFFPQKPKIITLLPRVCVCENNSTKLFYVKTHVL